MLELEKHLGARVIGQDHALERHLRSACARRRPASRIPNKPIGVFLLVGPSGVGKTETALALADLLYGGERNLITINMSRVPGSAHRLHAEGLASGLRGLRRRRRAHRSGAPAALLGRAARRSGEGAPRRAGAVLPGVRQGHDGGRRGARRSTSRTRIIILTSNAGTDTIMKLTADPETMPVPGGAGQGAQARAGQDLQARVPRAHGDHPVLSRCATRR